MNATLTPYRLTTIPLTAIPDANVKDQMIECNSFAFIKASPFTSFGRRDISVVKNIEALDILINKSTNNIQISDKELIIKKQSVMINSTKSKNVINFFADILSIRLPLNGAKTIAGIKCIAVIKDISNALVPNSTNIL
ncbi:hypothetical protein MNB_ARC-1_862 [hydrothermal vent metagenome]|uniref:Uncharacterized protein n=1 Tax=hydrothermal vent metagenome TaxID=652676 RepID=A0A3B1DVY5_9ZZZZ